MSGFLIRPGRQRFRQALSRTEDWPSRAGADRYCQTAEGLGARLNFIALGSLGSI